MRKRYDALQSNGSPLPEFETDEAHDYFVSRLYIHPAFLDDTSSNQNLLQNETRMKQVLKHNDYEKLLLIRFIG